MRRILTKAIVSAALCAACAVAASGQPSPVKPGADEMRPAAEAVAGDARKSAEGEKKLTAEERQLVEGSRAAIVATGLSNAYFDTHFKLAGVYAAAGDRRIVWKYAVGEYEATLNDAVGFYTDDRGRRVDVHSIGGLLVSAREVGKTITRRRAERIMKSCIGEEHTGGSVVYQAHGMPRRAALLLIATTMPKPVKLTPKEEREKKARELAAERAAASGQNQQADKIREGGKKRPMYVGAVDLETGKCTRGRAQAGAMPPDKSLPRP